VWIVRLLLFLCFALVLLLWIKSYVQSDTLCWDYGRSTDPSVRRTQWSIQSRRGKIAIGRFDYLPKRDSDWRLGPMGGDCTGTIRYRSRGLPLDWIGPQGSWGHLDFAYRHTVSGVFPTIAYPNQVDDLWILTFPHWALAIVLGVYPLVAYRRIARLHRRRKLGLCLHCGYDLQGLTSDRCPECGTSVNGGGGEG
jgi:hypothetical protein